MTSTPMFSHVFFPPRKSLPKNYGFELPTWDITSCKNGIAKAWRLGGKFGGSPCEVRSRLLKVVLPNTSCHSRELVDSDPSPVEDA